MLKTNKNKRSKIDLLVKNRLSIRNISQHICELCNYRIYRLNGHRSLIFCHQHITDATDR